jgi:glutamyl-tRNA synthetase
VVNTPRQILMYQAMDYPVPVFAHLPMILGADKQRLSKRHGAVSVLQYRDEGYLPGALVNYLARLGWSHGDQEIFTREELIEKFDWEHVGATAGVFNPEKLLWLNQQWIMRTPSDEHARRLEPLLETRGIAAGPELVRIVDTMKPRAKTLLEIAEAARIFLRDRIEYDPAAVKKHLTPEAKPLLQEARGLVASRLDGGAHALEAAFRDLAAQKGVALGKLAQPVRVAVTGTTVSPPLFDTIEILGRDRALSRIDEALRMIGG